MNLWLYMLLPCAVVIAGNCLASVLSFYVRHSLREKIRWLELTIQLGLASLMTFVYPAEVADSCLRHEDFSTIDV